MLNDVNDHKKKKERKGYWNSKNFFHLPEVSNIFYEKLCDNIEKKKHQIYESENFHSCLVQ